MAWADWCLCHSLRYRCSQGAVRTESHLRSLDLSRSVGRCVASAIASGSGAPLPCTGCPSLSRGGWEDRVTGRRGGRPLSAQPSARSFSFAHGAVLLTHRAWDSGGVAQLSTTGRAPGCGDWLGTGSDCSGTNHSPSPGVFSLELVGRAYFSFSYPRLY